jgi:apolipoprotein N-acyltransferase
LRLPRNPAFLLLAGAVSALGLAPLDLWFLTFAALAFVVARIVRVSGWRDAFLQGWVFGVGHFLLGLNWIATAFTYQAKMPAWYGWAAVLLLSLYLALFPGMAAALAWRISRRHPLAFAFLFAAAWMLGEWLRGTVLTGFSWNPLAAVWLPLPWVAQSAMWIGTYGLSGLAVLLAGLLSTGLHHRRRITLGALAMFAGVAAVSGEFTTPPPATGTIAVRVVQPNIGQREKHDSAQDEQHAGIYAMLSGKPSSTPRLILWPEAATPHFLEYESAARLQLAALLGPRDILLTGAESVALDLHGNDDIYRNSVFALDSSGNLLWRYDKSHLVPFGEYLPARWILGRLGLSRLVPGEGDFSPGPGPRTFALPGFTLRKGPATVGVQICYEIIFPGRVIDEARRPSFLFNPSNDAWFSAWGPPQHLAQARLRAIEEGIAVIRATPNGISALISPTGRLIASVPPHHAGVIDGVLPEPLPPTFFARHGLGACALFGLFLSAVGIALSATAQTSAKRIALTGEPHARDVATIPTE